MPSRRADTGPNFLNATGGFPQLPLPLPFPAVTAVPSSPAAAGCCERMPREWGTGLGAQTLQQGINSNGLSAPAQRSAPVQHHTAPTTTLRLSSPPLACLPAHPPSLHAVEEKASQSSLPHSCHCTHSLLVFIISTGAVTVVVTRPASPLTAAAEGWVGGAGRGRGLEHERETNGVR
jgi:hypothetical protein